MANRSRMGIFHMLRIRTENLKAFWVRLVFYLRYRNYPRYTRIQ